MLGFTGNGWVDIDEQTAIAFADFLGCSKETLIEKLEAHRVIYKDNKLLFGAVRFVGLSRPNEDWFGVWQYYYSPKAWG